LEGRRNTGRQCRHRGHNGDAQLDLFVGNGQTSYVAPDQLFRAR
jgi:hypothetical protein